MVENQNELFDEALNVDKSNKTISSESEGIQF